VKPAAQAVDEIRTLLRGRPGFLVGSAVAGEVYDKPYNDVDVFVPSVVSLASTVQFLLDDGASLDLQAERTWNRWDLIGTGDWNTNSIKLETLHGTEVNVVYKVVNKAPLTTLHTVLGSFDFGYVAMGYDLRLGTWHDGREFWFGRGCDMDRLGMLPEREMQWLNGSLGTFTGVRQAERYAKFANRGYDMSRSAPVLVQGYRITAAHYQLSDDPEKLEYAGIYLSIADLIETGDVDGLLYAYQHLRKHDPVGSLKAALP
jgi:hypothetical protein